jgi:hypothetical protein
MTSWGSWGAAVASSIGDNVVEWVVWWTFELAFFSAGFSAIAMGPTVPTTAASPVLDTTARFRRLRTQAKATRPLANKITIGTTTAAMMVVFGPLWAFSWMPKPGVRLAALVSEEVAVLIYDGAYECQPGRPAGCVHE